MRMFRPLLLAALVALPLGGCAMQSDGPGGAMAMGDMTPNGRTAYVQMAAASDLFEIQSSNLARTRSQNAEVRQFAEMLVTHHTQMTAQLMAAASAAGVQPAPMLMPMQARMMTELQSALRAGFDRVYMTNRSRRTRWRWLCTATMLARRHRGLAHGGKRGHADRPAAPRSGAPARLSPALPRRFGEQRLAIARTVPRKAGGGALRRHPSECRRRSRRPSAVSGSPAALSVTAAKR
jgi:predicted outer membrane protein